MTILQRFLTTVVKGYQVLISPLLGPRCRFHPSCSSYTSEAISQFGAARGLWIGLRRLARCHPWADGGHDPVPQRKPSGKHPSIDSAKAEQ